ncbi:MAG: DUF2147 domain-containing protein [Beijerinckiaceae bacterium]|nr:DUF2147 domain-containing protein [Beijerinckiaceae bacterium]
MRFVKQILVLAACVMASAAAAQEATGTWVRDTGDAHVRFGPCGAYLCGTISWVKDTTRAGEIGRRVFYDMKQDGPGAWKGQAFNPEDGKTYSGKMTLAGDVLTTSGCVLGGLFCKTVVWSRVK